MAMTCGFDHHLIDVVRHGDQDGGHTAFRPCEIQLNFGLELDNNNETHRVYKYRNKILKRKRNDSTGNYDLYVQHLSNDSKRRLKNTYGGNGDISNISSSFLLKFPNAKYSDVSQNTLLKGQLLSAFKTFDSTGILSVFDIDTDAPNESELSIYINISWESSDSNAETQANALITAVKNSTSLTNIFTALPVPTPFDVVQLDTSLNAITIDTFVTPTIHSLVTTYNSGPDNTDIEVKTVGLYDHIGIKINSESDNEYRRLRTNGVKTLNISGVNPDEDIIIVTLFNHDYKPLYTSIQRPIVFIQQTQGTNGDILNEGVDGSMTLNLDHNDFITNNQSDFITTMNAQTGGFTIVINVYAGSAIVVYRVVFDSTKTQQEIDAVVTKLNNDTEVQNIINTSATMNGVTSVKTVGTTTEKKGQVVVSYAGITSVKYDGVNSKIKFNIVGAYKNILYKATGQGTFITTTNTTVDPPPGFTDQIDIKLTNVNDNDITSVATYTVDAISPIITLIGDNVIYLLLGKTYNELGANVTDNSGENINAVITGTVDVNTLGVYVLSYNASDSNNNAATQVQRTVHIVNSIPSYEYVYPNPAKIVATGPNYDLSNPNWTFESYFYFANAGTGQTLYYLYSSTTNNSILIRLWVNSPTEGIHVGLFLDGSALSTHKPIHPTVFNENVWNHCALQYDSGTYSFWLNGAKRGTFTGVFQSPASFDSISLGEYLDSPALLPLKDSNKISDTRLVVGTSIYSGTTYLVPPNGLNIVANTVFLIKGPNIFDVTGVYNTTITGTITKNAVDLSTNTEYFVDTVGPVITLIGNNPMFINLNDTYVEPGANVTDNSGETPTPVITGTVDVNNYGSYIISYNASDSSGNTATQVQRTVNVIDTHQSFPGYSGFNGNTSTYQNLLDKNEGVTFVGDNLYNNLYFIGSDYKFSRSCKFKYNGVGHRVIMSMNGTSNSRNYFQLWVHNSQAADLYNPIGQQKDTDDTGRHIEANKWNTDIYALETYDKTTNSYTIRLSTSKLITDEFYYYTENVNFFETDPPTNPLLNCYVGKRTDNQGAFSGDITEIKMSHTIMTWDEAWPDIIPPVITLLGPSTINSKINFDVVLFDYNATDNIDTNLNVVITDNINKTTLGSYTANYNTTDVGGNNAIEVVRNINIVNELGKTIAGSSGFNTGSAYFNLTDNTFGTIAGDFTEPNYVASDYMLVSDFKFSFVCTFNLPSLPGGHNTIFYFTDGSNYISILIFTSQLSIYNSNINRDTIALSSSIIAGNDYKLGFIYDKSTQTYKAKLVNVTNNDVIVDVVQTGRDIPNVARNDMRLGSGPSGSFVGSITNITIAPYALQIEQIFPSPPIITLNGLLHETAQINKTYNDPGVLSTVNYARKTMSAPTIVDNVNDTTLGSYTITYDSPNDDYGVSTQVIRNVDIVTKLFEYSSGNSTGFVDNTTHIDLLDNTAGLTYPEVNFTAANYGQGSNWKLSYACQFIITDSTRQWNTLIDMGNLIQFAIKGNSNQGLGLIVHGNGIYNHHDIGVLNNTLYYVLLTVDRENLTYKIEWADNKNGTNKKIYSGTISGANTGTPAHLVLGNKNPLSGTEYFVGTIQNIKLAPYLITWEQAFTIDITPPTIVLNNGSTTNVALDGTYNEPGATVIDDSGETINAVITGTVDVNTIGTYLISYNASDSSGNAATQVQRTVNVVDSTRRFAGIVNITSTNLLNLKNNTQYGGFSEDNIVSADYISTSNYKFTFAAKLYKTGNIDNDKIFYFDGGGNEFALYFTSQTTARFDYYGGTIWNLTFTFLLDTIYYIKLMLDHENSEVTLGIRSDLDTPLYEVTQAKTLNIGERTGDWIIGTHKYATNEYWGGSIVDIAISDKLLTWSDAFPAPTNIVTRTFAGITSANAPNNYINLLNNTEALGFAENNLNNIYMDEAGYEFSVACKFKATAFNPAWNTVYSIHGPGVHQLLLGNNNSGEMRLYIYNTAGQTNEVVINVTLNTDYYTLFTYDHAAQSYTFRWNTSYSETGITTSTQNSKNLEIGTGSDKWRFGDSYWVDQEWIGPINDITISNKILTWAETWPIPNVTRTFAGSSSIGASPNYLYLPNNTLGLTFPEQNINVANYLQGSNHKLTYACKFNANTWRAWARLLDISNGTNADEILLKTDASGSVAVFAYSTNPNYNEDSGVNLSTGTDYYLLFTYDRAITSFTLVISTNFDGSSPVVNMTRNNTTFSDGTRVDWYIGISRYAIANPGSWGNEYFDGSITDITLSNTLMAWNEVWVDATPPIITLIGDNPFLLELNTPYVEPGANVNDNVDTGLSATITGTVDHTTLGTYYVSYNVTDSSGNAAVQVQRTVNVLNLNNYYDMTSDNIKVNQYSTNTLTSNFTTNPYKLSVSNGIWFIKPSLLTAFDITTPWRIIFRTLKTAGPHFINLYFNMQDINQYENSTHSDASTYRISFEPYNGFYRHYLGQSNIFNNTSNLSGDIMDSISHWVITYDGTDININILNDDGLAITPVQSINTAANQLVMTNGRVPVAFHAGGSSPTYDIFDNVLFSYGSAHDITDYRLYKTIKLTFAGSSSFGAPPNYIDLANNSEGLTIPEASIVPSYWLQGNDFQLCFACRVYITNVKPWTIFLTIGNGDANSASDVIFFALPTTPGKIIFYDTSQSFTQHDFTPSANTYYYILLNYNKSTSAYSIEISQNSNGSGSTTFNGTTNITPLTRTNWNLGANIQYNVANDYLEGTIDTITLANRTQIWSEAFP